MNKNLNDTDKTSPKIEIKFRSHTRKKNELKDLRIINNMGACASSKNSVKVSRPVVEMPLSFYLDRKKGALFTFKGKQVRSQKFQENRKFPIDSAMGVSSDNAIFIAGGSFGPSKVLHTEVIQIRPTSNSFEILSSLPVPAKHGSLIQYGQFLYYVGGSTEEERGLPLMRFSRYLNQWEVFDGEAIFQRHTIDIKDILYPGAFLLNSKIYLVGGFIQTTKRPNTRIFSLHLSSENLNFTQEDIRLPVNIFSPLCTWENDSVIILGGKSSLYPEEYNKRVFKIEAEGFITEKAPLPWKMIENCPAMYRNKSLVVFSYPDVGVLKDKYSKWLYFDFITQKEKKNSVICQVDNETPPLEPVRYDKSISVQVHKGEIVSSSSRQVYAELLKAMSPLEISSKNESSYNQEILNSSKKKHYRDSSEERYKLENSFEEAKDQTFRRNESFKDSSKMLDAEKSRNGKGADLSLSSLDKNVDNEIPGIEIQIPKSLVRPIPFENNKKINSRSSNSSLSGLKLPISPKSPEEKLEGNSIHEQEISHVLKNQSFRLSQMAESIDIESLEKNETSNPHKKSHHKRSASAIEDTFIPGAIISRKPKSKKKYTNKNSNGKLEKGKVFHEKDKFENVTIRSGFVSEYYDEPPAIDLDRLKMSEKLLEKDPKALKTFDKLHKKYCNIPKHELSEIHYESSIKPVKSYANNYENEHDTSSKHFGKSYSNIKLSNNSKLSVIEKEKEVKHAISSSIGGAPSNVKIFYVKIDDNQSSNSSIEAKISERFDENKVQNKNIERDEMASSISVLENYSRFTHSNESSFLNSEIPPRIERYNSQKPNTSKNNKNSEVSENFSKPKIPKLKINNEDKKNYYRISPHQVESTGHNRQVLSNKKSIESANSSKFLKRAGSLNPKMQRK